MHRIREDQRKCKTQLTCKRGHRWTKSNTHIYTNKLGYTSYTCRQCVYERHRTPTMLMKRWEYRRSLKRLAYERTSWLQRKNLPTYRARRRRQEKSYRQLGNSRYQAYWILRNALLNGQIRKDPCCQCGERKTQAHHPDYNKPLEVIWLCGMHHRELHSNLRKPEVSYA